jgi:uncharacterized protein YqeY
MRKIMSTGIRDRLSISLIEALKSKNPPRLGTLRLINAALKDQDIALRVENREVGDSEVLIILSKMVKQRQESIKAYEEGGRLELAEKERLEILIIEEFLPIQLTEDQTENAVLEAIKETGAESIRDMGKVMARLKSKHTGQINFSTVGPMVKGRLSQ